MGEMSSATRVNSSARPLVPRSIATLPLSPCGIYYIDNAMSSKK